MKIYLTLLISLLSLSFLVSGAYAAQNQNVAAYPALTTKIVKVNKEFQVVLKSNPTTGYSWMAKYDSNYVKLINSRYIPYKTKPGIVGSGGIQIFTFKAIKPGKTVIMMQYQRPWAETVPPLKEVRYNLIILR